MQTPSVNTLIGLIAWTLLLLLLMVVLRIRAVATKVATPTQFRPDNANLSPFMQRLARAHANCIEGLPVFGGLLAVALMTSKTNLTDGLAYVLLAARVLQSGAHLVSAESAAVNARFLGLLIQITIAAYWTYALLVH